MHNVKPTRNYWSEEKALSAAASCRVTLALHTHKHLTLLLHSAFMYIPPGTLVRLFMLTQNYSPFQRAGLCEVPLHRAYLPLCRSQRVKGAQMIVIQIWFQPVSYTVHVPPDLLHVCRGGHVPPKAYTHTIPRQNGQTHDSKSKLDIEDIKENSGFSPPNWRHLIYSTLPNWYQMFGNPIC